ncbi:quercetin dioxygenase-like cupin family protein [Mycobacterium frederiksbergense]|uniref:Quercetin dioxygenase-like cupin family protein n=1 Tax=Mycolicibacterium frederiksbergense TaxID=117567 RepID=A0ABT6L6E4_9MYCO|nr:cupin domain-containing protein [Mycolicibacterium frederiksbergense]MDH6198495.1 quercetin dioxygenase-like cupin family protein [Mycolicibacterium frederiksbergense]
MTELTEKLTPAKVEAPGGAYVSDPARATIVMGGSEWDGAPQIPGTKLIYHALYDRTDGQVTIAEVTFPAGQRPWFHIHHGEDEAFYVVEGQLTVTVIDHEGVRHKMVANAGEMVWGPKDYAHSYHVTSEGPTRTIIVLTPGNTLPAYFQYYQNLELDPNDPVAVAAFVKEARERYNLEFLPHLSLDD